MFWPFGPRVARFYGTQHSHKSPKGEEGERPTQQQSPEKESNGRHGDVQITESSVDPLPHPLPVGRGPELQSAMDVTLLLAHLTARPLRQPEEA